jgi:hypothetical protein
MNTASAPKIAKRKSIIDSVDVLSIGDSLIKEADSKAGTFTSIICVKTTEFKYYVYSQNGVLINRIDFSNLVDAYGHPI